MGSLSYPEDMRLSKTETVLGGQCFLCGAHYIVDPTGKNVGEAMVQGLEMAAGELGKDLTTLSDEDYEDFVLRYDVRNHESLGPASNQLDCYGRLYVIRVKKSRND
jgi:hypothetical protein